jgi:flagellar hook assembly protein FlgD
VPAHIALAPARTEPGRGRRAPHLVASEASDVELAVFDHHGREVARLANGTYAAGEHALDWKALDNGGRMLPTGTYLYRLRTPHANLVRKLVLVR